MQVRGIHMELILSERSKPMRSSLTSNRYQMSRQFIIPITEIFLEIRMISREAVLENRLIMFHPNRI